jgi:hypothetical protein
VLYISVGWIGWAAPAAAERIGNVVRATCALRNFKNVEMKRIFYSNRLYPFEKSRFEKINGRKR